MGWIAGMGGVGKIFQLFMAASISCLFFCLGGGRYADTGVWQSFRAWGIRSSTLLLWRPISAPLVRFPLHMFNRISYLQWVFVRGS